MIAIFKPYAENRESGLPWLYSVIPLALNQSPNHQKPTYVCRGIGSNAA